MWYEASPKPQRKPTPAKTAEETLICQPRMAVNARLTWIIWSVSIPLYLLILSAVSGCKDRVIVHDVQGWIFVIGIVVVPFALCWPPAAVYFQRARIVASPDGLWWRGAFRSRFSPWEDVTDYYDTFRVYANNGRQTIVQWMSVETRQGQMRLSRSDQGWTHESELRDYITAHAAQAKAKTWGVLRRRPEDFPVVCHYDTLIHRHAPRFLKEWHGITLAGVIAYFAWSWWAKHVLPGWGWLLTPSGLFLIVKESIVLALHPTYSETRRRLGQTITLTSESVTFQEETKQITATWDEITDFYTVGLWGPRFVETLNGTFSFLWTLREGELPQQMLLNNAPCAEQTFWCSRFAAPKHRQPETA